jgi:hypothetical protein
MKIVLAKTAMLDSWRCSPSEGDDQFPANAPSIWKEEKGLAVFFFSDGAKYLDYGMGLRSVNIGYGNKPQYLFMKKKF